MRNMVGCSSQGLHQIAAGVNMVFLSRVGEGLVESIDSSGLFHSSSRRSNVFISLAGRSCGRALNVCSG